MNFLLDLMSPWGYILIFMLGAAEGAALIGLFLPGETAMLLGGVLAYQGRANLVVMLVAGCLGAVIGDSTGYWIGRRFGPALRRTHLGRRVGDERWRRAGDYLRNWGGKAVFWGRFLGFLRTLVPPLAGSTEMPYGRFVAFNAPAGTLWAAAFILMGFAAGRSWKAVDAWAGRGSAVLLALVALAVAVAWTARVIQRRRGYLRGLWQRLRDDETVVHLRRRFAPQIEFVRRRLDPAGASVFTSRWGARARWGQPPRLRPWSIAPRRVATLPNSTARCFRSSPIMQPACSTTSWV
ncbi:MAG: DedA family protein [Actinomycetota bacterium]|nr:DedA family protein [Actinomycetota bacterium]